MANAKHAEVVPISKHKKSDNGKDENTKAADLAHKRENEKDPSEKDGQTTIDPTVEREKPNPKVENIEAVYKEEPTKEQKIINYIAGSKTQNVDLVPLLKSLYPIATHTDSATYRNQGEAKRLRILLEKMVGEGQITMLDDGYQKLGRHFYGEDTKTQFHTLDSVKIIAVK